MRATVTGVTAVKITGEFIKLDQFLKLIIAVSSGGEAKATIQNGEAKVNGEACFERGRKLRDGDLVRFAARTYVVRSTTGQLTVDN
jgi:ribosome-associated protein